MRPSRGMGCMKSEKLPKKIRRKDNPQIVDEYKKGGRTKLPALQRIVSVDRLSKAERATHKIGKQKPGQTNFGNMSKFK